MGPEVESSSQLGTDGAMRPLLRMACWLNKQVRPQTWWPLSWLSRGQSRAQSAPELAEGTDKLSRKHREGAQQCPLSGRACRAREGLRPCLVGQPWGLLLSVPDLHPLFLTRPTRPVRLHRRPEGTCMPCGHITEF